MHKTLIQQARSIAEQYIQGSCSAGEQGLLEQALWTLTGTLAVLPEKEGADLFPHGEQGGREGVGCDVGPHPLPLPAVGEIPPPGGGREV